MTYSTPVPTAGPFEGLPLDEVADETVASIRLAVRSVFKSQRSVEAFDRTLLGTFIEIANETLELFEPDAQAPTARQQNNRRYLDSLMRRLPLGTGNRPRIACLLNLLEELIAGEITRSSETCELIMAQIKHDAEQATN